MKSNKKDQSKNKNPFNPDEEKKIGFEGVLPAGVYQREYFIGYSYRYWLHKGLALMHFIDDNSRLSALRSPKGFSEDYDSDEFIIENLKMEIHMMVFHSAESLFLTILGHYFCPAVPWFWMSTCDQTKLNTIMNIWQEEKGVEAIIKEPEKWLRDALYSTVNESHQHYERSKESATFARKYLDRLAREYMKHNEYNAYKQGLRVFPGPGSFKATNDVTGKVYADIQGNFLGFLTNASMYYTPCILYSRHKPLAHSVRTNVDFRPSLATPLTRTISEASLNCTYIYQHRGEASRKLWKSYNIFIKPIRASYTTVEKIAGTE